jgi:Ca2+/Na+ antiporter
MTDPLTLGDRIEQIAVRSNSSTRTVLALRALHAHPACFNPFKTLRELWLDRAILFGLVVLGSFQFFTFMNVFTRVSIWWFIVPFALLLPIFIFYARSVHSEIQMGMKEVLGAVPTAARITGVGRVVQGHTHVAQHSQLGSIEYLNTGTWTDITSFDPGQLGRLSRPTYALIEYPPNTQPGQAGALPRVALQVWRGRHREWEQFEL